MTVEKDRSAPKEHALKVADVALTVAQDKLAKTIVVQSLAVHMTLIVTEDRSATEAHVRQDVEKMAIVGMPNIVHKEHVRVDAVHTVSAVKARSARTIDVRVDVTGMHIVEQEITVTFAKVHAVLDAV